MPLKNDTPLSVQEQAVLITRLKEDQPDAGQVEVDALLKWAENVRVGGALLDSIEAGEVKISVKNGKVTVRRQDNGSW